MKSMSAQHLEEAMKRVNQVEMRLDAGSESEPDHIDYSEEAIPERDPAYRPLDDTICESPTVELMPAEVRLALARELEQLGMNPTRAAMVASL
jgi:hypothetical protein